MIISARVFPIEQLTKKGIRVANSKALGTLFVLVIVGACNEPLSMEHSNYRLANSSAEIDFSTSGAADEMTKEEAREPVMVGGAFLACHTSKDLSHVTLDCLVLSEKKEKVHLEAKNLAELQIIRNGMATTVDIEVNEPSNSHHFSVTVELPQETREIRLEAYILPDNVRIDSGPIEIGPLKVTETVFTDGFEALGQATIEAGFDSWWYISAYNDWLINWLPSKSDLEVCPSVPMIEFQTFRDSGGVYFPPAQEGVYFLELNSGCLAEGGPYETKVIISRDVTTSVGEWYELDFYYRGRLNASASHLLVKVGDKLVLDMLQEQLPGDWTRFSYVFRADSELIPISFADDGPRINGSFGAYIDNIRFSRLE